MTGPNYTVSVGHGDIVSYAPFLRELINAENFLDRIREPVVDVESESRTETIAAPGDQTQQQNK